MVCHSKAVDVWMFKGVDEQAGAVGLVVKDVQQNTKPQ